MKFIIGLGNPGEKYEHTRHNAGFLFLDFLRAEWNFPPFCEEKKFASSVSTGVRGIEKTLLIKPGTFMNRSGEATAILINFYKCTPHDILIVHDDLDIPFGSWKASKGSGSAGHNGISDIIEKIGTKDFQRIRIGIGRPPENTPAEHYVVEPYTEEERLQLREIFEDIFHSLKKDETP